MMIRHRFLSLITLAAALFTGFPLVANAYQPRGVMTVGQEIASEGSARQIRGTFILENVTEYPLLLRFSPIKTESFSFDITARQTILKPGESIPVEYNGAIFQDGKWQINFQLDLFSEQEVLAGRHTVDVYFLVQGGRYQVASYEDLFLRPDVEEPGLGASFISREDTGVLRRAPDIKAPAMEDLLRINPEGVFKIPTSSGVGEQQIDPRILRPSLRLENPNLNLQTPLERLKAHAMDSLPLPPESTQIAQSAVRAQGRFSWKGMDNNLHSAFGWRVRAWRRRGSNWVKVAEDWIQSDGRWQLSFPQESGRVKFQYVAFNRFFTPQSSSGDTYRWVGPERSSVPLNHNEGSWYADTSGGAVRGLGEIYHEGMHLWSKLYWTGEINPLRDDSIRVFFPNTSYDCGAGDGIPWSCASRDGRIWLIPAHASRNGVMQHELAHQINYEFWNNNLPPNSGGSHSLGSCYTPGLALVEGFANFMVFWAQTPRNTAPSAGFDFAVENPTFACTTDNRNESWVAATFWDLHDTHGDGNDNLWFIHEGATPGIYLRNGRENSMADFHPIYRNAANDEHEVIIDNIFRQDNIIP
ncbi:MAG: hypothetical protein VKJ86_00235 [Synechococcus sp.]|nr:hypothetical protein [Synechococcus sp.]